MMTQFEYGDDPERIVIEMCGSHIWDAPTVAIRNKYERHGKHVVIEGLNEASTLPHARLAGNLAGATNEADAARRIRVTPGRTEDVDTGLIS